MIAGRSSSQYKHTDKDLAQIARELGATHLVTAKVRWAKAADGSRRVQVSPELVQVTPGGAPTTRWQQSFDAAMTDVFQVQADVAGRVAQELGVALADSARRELAERPTRNLEAYDLYLRAEAASLGVNRTDPASLRAAIPLYERAVARDSVFVQAWARLAVARSFLWNNSTPTPELAVQARTAAERALALAPKEVAPALAMATYYRIVERQHEPALRALQDVLPLAPKDPLILSSLAVTELNLGRVESALEHLREARRLDPRSLVLMYNMGTSLLYLRRYDDADSVLDKALELEPGNLNGILARVQARLGRGDLGGARAIVSRASAELDPRTVGVHFATYYELHWVLDSPSRRW